MEFIQAFNALYAVPIVAVIICAFIVYAFGFKSPVQPPSFDGIDEDKKYIKKKRAKDNQKGKLLQNGKLNGNAISKSNVPSAKKKDSSEKHSPSGKAVTPEKSVVIEKKASKKSRAQNEKKSVEKKKESISNDDMNDGEWVQLVSKKGRKNRKKDEILPAEKQSDASKSTKMTDVSKSDEIYSEEIPRNADTLASNNVAVDRKQDSEMEKEENGQIDADLISTLEESNIQTVATETIHLDKELPKESKTLEEGNKTKKSLEIVPPEKDSITSVSVSSAVQVTPEISSSQDNSASNIVNASEYLKVVSETRLDGNSRPQKEDMSREKRTCGKAESDQNTTLKSSNVAFDELEGLFPEAKEQKRRKRVRRDH